METKGWANRGERKSEGGRKCVRLGREKRRARMKTMEERGHTEDNTHHLRTKAQEKWSLTAHL
jgi:hypothetical protein